MPVSGGALLLFVPLLRDFHFESAMLAGIIGCFWAGIRSSKTKTDSDFFSALKILGFLYLSGFPLFVYALSSGCLTFDGFAFWLLIPFPSVLLGSAVGRLIRKFKFPFPRTLTFIVLLFCALGVWVIEFFSFPQVYFYNHVWGIWPGPIYDETVQLTGAFIYFRLLTFFWIILLWILPGWSRNTQTKFITALALLSLLFSYLNLDEAGIISPRESIQRQLGGQHQTEHFDLYFDPQFYNTQEIKYWAERHEFYFHQIIEELNVKLPEERKIESYLYAHAWQKKSITGAKFTSYVPIWLEQDQLHIAKQQLERVLKHELVHVVTKQFGNRLFNGSWSIGLIEGLAEAIAGDASSESTLHQIVAGEKPLPAAEEITTSLSFWGFYSNAGAISYTTTGSFIKYLLDYYPITDLKKAYRTSDFADSYSTSMDTLVEGWHQTLRNTPLDSVDQQVSEFIFAQQSLFEKPCPHSVTRELRLWDRYQFNLVSRDTLAAHRTLNLLYNEYPNNELVKRSWMRSQLLQQNYKLAASAITPKDTLLTLQVLQADALFLDENYQQANRLLSQLAPRIESSQAPNLRFTLDLRSDHLQWSYHVKRRYQGVFVDSSSFAQLNLPNQMLSLNKALLENQHEWIRLYALLLSSHNPNPHWFDIYESTIDKLAYMGEFDLAKTWLQLASDADLRLRYQQRLDSQRHWLQYLASQSGVAD